MILLCRNERADGRRHAETIENQNGPRRMPFGCHSNRLHVGLRLIPGRFRACSLPPPR